MVLALLPLSQLLIGLFLQGSPEPQTKPQITIEDVNLVGSFLEDGETRMEVTLRLPNDCYEVKKVDLRFDQDRDTLLFYPEMVQVKSKTPLKCSTDTVTTVQWVNLGQLNEGSYQIRELMSLKRWAKFKIAKSEPIGSETIGFYKH